MLSYGDIEKAKRIVGHGIGREFLVDGTSIPKSVGVKGDERVYNGAIMLSASQSHLREVYSDPEGQRLLEKVASDILNCTQACRVVIDITPDLPADGLSLIKQTS
ncbi:MAG TPA: hypothetical protein VLG25_03180 [Patescibacteria group bacterium]|nr:hypothetical protein [Patescibacteria group bacterium]